MDNVEVVAAVLHRVGKRRTRRGSRLSEVFSSAAREFPELFRRFVAHPAYGDCPALDDAPDTAPGRKHRLLVAGALSSRGDGLCAEMGRVAV